MNVQLREDRIDTLILAEQHLSRISEILFILLNGNSDASRNGLEYKKIDFLETDVINLHQKVKRYLKEEGIDV